jgi:hypothetical protein
LETALELVRTMNAKLFQRPTLVLNRNWQPVNVATVARALPVGLEGNQFALHMRWNRMVDTLVNGTV